MKKHLPSKQKGITLIELLIAMVISGILIAAIYRLFVTQSKAYVIQDQVVEVQQGTRSAMQIVLRDLRMAGFDGNNTTSALLTAIFPGDNPPAVRNDAVRVEYRIGGILNTKAFYRDPATSQLRENFLIDGVQQPGYPIVLLDNVNQLAFAYGVDGKAGFEDTQDGTMDDRNGDGIINDNDWVSGATVTGGNLHVVAVRVTLTASPAPVNPDIPKMVQPRTLVSATTLRNLSLLKTN